MRCVDWHMAGVAYASARQDESRRITRVMAQSQIASLRLPEYLARFVQEQAEKQFRSRNSWLAELIAREYEAVNAAEKQAG